MKVVIVKFGRMYSEFGVDWDRIGPCRRGAPRLCD